MSGIKNTFLALCIGTLFVSGCAETPDTYPLISQPLSGPRTLDMQGTSYKAADSMLVKMFDKLRIRDTAILPASFVNERDMDKTTPFGRLISRQFANRFTQGGYNMVEIKLRKNFLLQQGHGQLMLTRELEKIRDAKNVHAVLAGSYVTTGSRVFVSAQVVRLKDGVTIAAEDFDIPLSKDVASLLVQ
jgi:TolB-like protein